MALACLRPGAPRILVTGAGGLLGSRIAVALAQEGACVLALAGRLARAVVGAAAVDGADLADPAAVQVREKKKQSTQHSEKHFQFLIARGDGEEREI